MNFEEKDIALSIDGMGIVFFSPETNKDISEGMNIDLFWLSEWSGECPPEQILSIKPGYYHIHCARKGRIREFGAMTRSYMCI